MFSSSATNITDEDIEAIMKRGERETMELNSKLQQFTDNARKFTLDGGMNIYEFKEDEDEDGNQLDLKTIIGNNWVDPPKRERKGRVQNYNEADYFKQTMKSSKSERTLGPRLPKMPPLQDFQFYNVKRVTELFEKENGYELFKHELNQKRKNMENQGASEDAIEQALQPTDDDPTPLTEDEQHEKDRLLEEGFRDWNRRDFNSFVRACEKYGRDNLQAIASEIDGKTEEEVKVYAKIFWKRYKELNDWEKIIKNIEKGEQKIQRQQDIMNAIAVKLDRYKNPWQELKIQYGANKGKAYTEEEDRFIICMVHKLGYGNWDDLKAEIRKSWRFRFDWFFKSRTPTELARRAETLIRLIEKENEDLEARDKEERKRSASGKKMSGSKASDSSGAAGLKKRKLANGGATPEASSRGTPPLKKTRSVRE